MILRQWGGSSHVEPPHLSAVTSKNTSGAGRILDPGAEGFQTSFSGLKGKVPDAEGGGHRNGFHRGGPGAGSRWPGCRGGPTCASLQSFPAPSFGR